MNVALIALAALVGVYDAAHPRQFRVSVVLCQGDPLGSRTEGNVKHLAEAVIATCNGQQAYCRTNRGEVTFTDVNGKRRVVSLGAGAEVLPLLQPNGQVKLNLSLTHTKRAAGAPGFTEYTVRDTRNCGFRHDVPGSDRGGFARIADLGGVYSDRGAARQVTADRARL